MPLRARQQVWQHNSQPLIDIRRKQGIYLDPLSHTMLTAQGFGVRVMQKPSTYPIVLPRCRTISAQPTSIKYLPGIFHGNLFYRGRNIWSFWRSYLEILYLALFLLLFQLFWTKFWATLTLNLNHRNWRRLCANAKTICRPPKPSYWQVTMQFRHQQAETEISDETNCTIHGSLDRRFTYSSYFLTAPSIHDLSH